MLHFFRNLLIFGEGGDGGAGAATGPSTGASEGADPTGVSVPDAGEQRRLTREERRARLEQKLKAEQEAQTQQPQTQPAPAEAKRPFEELIKGEYKEDYGKAVQATLQPRLENLKKAEARGKDAEELLAQLVGNKYGLKAGDDGKLDLKAVREAMQNDDDLYEGLAAEMGTSVEFARKYDELQKKAQAAEQQQREQERYNAYMRVRNAAAEAQKAFPDMDLEATVLDPRFTRLLDVLPPAAAYHALHQVELTTNAMQYAVDTTRAGIAASIQAGQNRPSEGGLGRQAPATTNRINKSPREMTRAERQEIRRRAERGEEVFM